MKKVNFLHFAGCEDINRWYENHQDCKIINIETHTYEFDYSIKSEYKVWFIEEE